jgi:hypothetical protein
MAMSTELIRLNVIDAEHSVSFLGPAHTGKAVAAACSHGATTWQQVLLRTQRYDPDWTRDVRRGILLFEEHHAPKDDPVPTGPRSFEPCDPFRIWDAETRFCSMEPASLGLLIFNLTAQRIIQVQNRHVEIRRQGRSRIRVGGKPTSALYHYSLPEEWAILP